MNFGDSSHKECGNNKGVSLNEVNKGGREKETKNVNLGWFSRLSRDDKGREGAQKLENGIDVIYGWSQTILGYKDPKEPFPVEIGLMDQKAWFD